MGNAFAEIVPLAIGVAISPIPIIAVILMLFSQRARVNGPAFLVGWIVGLTLVTGIVVALSTAAGSSSGGTSTFASVLKVVLGALLVFIGFRQWQSRPMPGDPPKAPPKWMATIDSISPGKALGFGLLLSAVNPKNLTLAAGAGISIGQAGLDTTGAIVLIVVFVALGSLSILVPVLYSLFGGEPARARLDGLRTWLGENSATVMSVLLFVIGIVLASKGLGGLF
jgi:Sap, sulfolipid-1-addressing protein